MSSSGFPVDKWLVAARAVLQALDASLEWSRPGEAVAGSLQIIVAEEPDKAADQQTDAKGD